MNETEYLAKHNLKYEDLTDEEKKTLSEMVKAAKESQLTTDRLTQYLIAMRESVSNELEMEPEYTMLFGFIPLLNRKQILLKARLRNYRLLLILLTNKDRQLASIDAALSMVTPSGKKT